MKYILLSSRIFLQDLAAVNLNRGKVFYQLIQTELLDEALVFVLLELDCFDTSRFQLQNSVENLVLYN